MMMVKKSIMTVDEEEITQEKMDEGKKDKDK